MYLWSASRSTGRRLDETGGFVEEDDPTEKGDRRCASWEADFRVLRSELADVVVAAARSFEVEVDVDVDVDVVAVENAAGGGPVAVLAVAGAVAGLDEDEDDGTALPGRMDTILILPPPARVNRIYIALYRGTGGNTAWSVCWYS